jgi:hypothetical protein
VTANTPPADASSTDRGTSNSQILKDLLSHSVFTTSVASLQAVVSQQLKKSWDTGLVNGVQTVLLPKNIDDLAGKSYLVNLYLYCLYQLGYEAERGNDEWFPKQKEDQRNEQFLRAFGIIVVTDDLPELPSNHGLVWKGICSSLNIWLNGQHNVDKSLFKTRRAVHPCEQIFGDIWGKNYPVQKKMLDTVIHYIRTKKTFNGDISELLLPQETIISEKGLNIEWSSDLVSPIEETLIQECLDMENVPRKSNVNFSNIKSITDVVNLTKDILVRNKSTKKFKDTIRSITSVRMTSVFSPYKGKSRDKARKKPIRELIDDIKGSIEYGAFNPSVWVKLIHVAPISSTIPGSQEEWNKFDRNKEKFVQALISKGIQDSTANQISLEVETVVKLTKS